jgi:hypothetical protein
LIARTCCRRSIKPSIATGFAASGIWRNPCKPALAAFCAELRQRTESPPPLGQQGVGQLTLDRSSCPSMIVGCVKSSEGSSSWQRALSDLLMALGRA